MLAASIQSPSKPSAADIINQIKSLLEERKEDSTQSLLSMLETEVLEGGSALWRIVSNQNWELLTPRVLSLITAPMLMSAPKEGGFQGINVLWNLIRFRKYDFLTPDMKNLITAPMLMSAPKTGPVRGINVLAILIHYKRWDFLTPHILSLITAPMLMSAWEEGPNKDINCLGMLFKDKETDILRLLYSAPSNPLRTFSFANYPTKRVLAKLAENKEVNFFLFLLARKAALPDLSDTSPEAKAIHDFNTKLINEARSFGLFCPQLKLKMPETLLDKIHEFLSGVSQEKKMFGEENLTLPLSKPLKEGKDEATTSFICDHVKTLRMQYQNNSGSKMIIEPAVQSQLKIRFRIILEKIYNHDKTRHWLFNRKFLRSLSLQVKNYARSNKDTIITLGDLEEMVKLAAKEMSGCFMNTTLSSSSTTGTMTFFAYTESSSSSQDQLRLKLSRSE